VLPTAKIYETIICSLGNNVFIIPVGSRLHHLNFRPHTNIRTNRYRYPPAISNAATDSDGYPHAAADCDPEPNAKLDTQTHA
jgi:hypothetical protein